MVVSIQACFGSYPIGQLVSLLGAIYIAGSVEMSRHATPPEPVVVRPCEP